MCYCCEWINTKDKTERDRASSAMLMILIGTTFVVVLLEICLDLSVDTQVYTQMGVEDGGDVGDVSWFDVGDLMLEMEILEM